MARATLPSAAAEASFTSGVVRIAAGRRGDRAGHIVWRQRPQQQAPAARTDGRQFAARRVAHQQQERTRRRLLENLEQRVGAFALQVVDGIDDGDAPTALARGRTEERHRFAHVVDADHGVELAGLLVEHAFEHQQVALRLRRNAAGNWIVRIDRERSRLLDRRQTRIGMREHEARQPIGQRRLAYARRPADQPGMRNAAAFVGIEQRALGFAMPEQRAGFARMADVAVGLVIAHGVVVSAAT